MNRRSGGKPTNEDPLSPGEVAWLVSRLQEGSAKPDEARPLIRWFCDAARTRQLDSLPHHLLEWLAHGFEQHLKGSSLEAALGLKAKLGRPPKDLAWRNVRIAAEVMYAKKKSGLALADNWKGEGIFNEVAADWGVAPERVRDLYYDPAYAEMAEAVLSFMEREPRDSD